MSNQVEAINKYLKGLKSSAIQGDFGSWTELHICIDSTKFT